MRDTPPDRHAPRPDDGAAAALEALARAATAAAAAPDEPTALRELLGGAAAALHTRVAVVRALDSQERMLEVRAVVTASPSLEAEVEGSRLPVAAAPADEADETAVAPPLVALGERAGAPAVLQLALRREGRLLGSLDLFRAGRPFSVSERLAARLVAAQLASLLDAGRRRNGNGSVSPGASLELVGEALAAGSDEERTAEEVARLAAAATAARSGVVWRAGAGEPRPVGTYRTGDREVGGVARAAVVRALDDPSRPPAADAEPVTLALGEPAHHVLQLWFSPEARPAESSLAALRGFAARAGHALRAGERMRTSALELERTRELLELAARLHAELSLMHRLDAVLDRVAELLGAVRVGVYLRERGRLVDVAARGLEGPHVAVAERLLELALGPFRARDALSLPAAADDVRLAGLGEELAATRIEGAVAVPLSVGDDVTGLLAVYVRRGRSLSEHEEALLTALAAQLAVALQNARLHERAMRLGSELESVLTLERRSARRLAALYEISRSFVESVGDQAAPLEATLAAIVRTVVDLVGVDAAVIRMPDARREDLVQRAIHVADEELEPALRMILGAPEPLEKLPGRRLLRQGRALVLDAETAAGLGGANELLVPFLAKGATAIVLPIRSAGELLGTLNLVSLDVERPITEEVVEIGLSVVAQAALAIDNARLYEHQKFFTESMQRSLLPSTLPNLPGFRVGAIYAGSSHVELGGDVYDYMLLPDGRLAVVLGDVTGHGVDAAADMAMAKFVFRSLAREHVEPGPFLAAANDVVCGEIGASKFITMLYLTVDPERGEVACASAGHPAPRLVSPDGSVRPLSAGGLALGIDPGQAYEAVRAQLSPGASVVLYTDGVIEARRAGELYGSERLDALLTARAALAPQDLAAAVIADCRAYAGGDLPDDCALVVIQRTTG